MNITTIFYKNEYSDFLKAQTKQCIISETIANESLAVIDVLMTYVEIEGKKLDDINKIINLFVERASKVLPDNTLRFYVSRLSNSLNLFLKSRSKSRIDVSYEPSKQSSVSKKMPTRITVKKSKRIFVPDDIKIPVVNDEIMDSSVEENNNDQIIPPISSEKVSVKQKSTGLKKKTKDIKKRSVASKRHSVKKIIPDKIVEPTVVNSSDFQYDFPVPIRHDLIVVIKSLPSNLKNSEYKKICSVIKALSQ
jgi:hypothetical protein